MKTQISASWPLGCTPLGSIAFGLMLLFSLDFSIASPAYAETPEGVWRGRWESSTTGHSGPMKARVTSNGDGSYDARFTGRFLVVVPFTYKTTLQSVSYDGSSTTLVANKSLGPFLGSYQMQAAIGNGQFNANFSAGKDSGRFSMVRRVR